MNGKIFVLVSTIIVTGCVPPEKPPVDVSGYFEPNVAQEYNVLGSSTIEGQAFLKQVGGGVVTCAGNEVYIMPRMQMTDQIISAVSRRAKVLPITPVAKDYPSAFRKTQCDAQGNFVFNELHAGDWFVGTDVQWGVPVGRYGVVRQEGGGLGSYVTTENNRSTRVILSNNNRM